MSNIIPTLAPTPINESTFSDRKENELSSNSSAAQLKNESILITNKVCFDLEIRDIRKRGGSIAAHTGDDTDDSKSISDLSFGGTHPSTRRSVKRRRSRKSLENSGSEAVQIRNVKWRGSTTSAGSSSTTTFWGKLVKKDDIWSDGNDEQTCTNKNKNKIREYLLSIVTSFSNIFSIVASSPFIIATTLFSFGFFCSLSVLAIHIISKQAAHEKMSLAIDTAEKAGFQFSKALDDATRGPLFAMSQFVQNIDQLMKLADQIGDRDSAESLAPPLTGKERTHRNITATDCKKPKAQYLFNKLSKSIKEGAKLGDILVSLQVAPKGVVCLCYPFKNFADFLPLDYMNSTAVLGHDLFYDPNSVEEARETVSSQDPVVIGPISLIQGNKTYVKESFIVRLAIEVPGYIVSVPRNKGPNETYDKWGFATAIINWEKAKEKTGLYEGFQRQGMEFSLSRSNTHFDEKSHVSVQKVLTIANSSRWDLLNQKNSVTISLSATSNIWKMTVGFCDGFDPSWKGMMEAIAVSISFLSSLLLMLALVAKKRHQLLLYNMMPRDVIKELQKKKRVARKYDEATIFFSDIVNFTTLSGKMNALDVMSMLDELYTGFDEIVIKRKVHKVETIGDAYIVIGGGPDNCQPTEGAEKVALFALDVLEFVHNFRTKQGAKITIRAGIASGPVVGGVVGTSLPKFTLFGDTVNFASRMESTSLEMKIQCSDKTYELLHDAPQYAFETQERREASQVGVYVKGKGHAHTWWITNATIRSLGKASHGILKDPGYKSQDLESLEVDKFYVDDQKFTSFCASSEDDDS